MEYLEVRRLIPEAFWIFQVSFCYWFLILVLVKELILYDFCTFLKIYFMTQHMICFSSNDISQVTLLNSVVQVFHILSDFLSSYYCSYQQRRSEISNNNCRFVCFLWFCQVCVIHFEALHIQKFMMSHLWIEQVIIWNVFISGYIFSWSQLYLKLI